MSKDKLVQYDLWDIIRSFGYTTSGQTSDIVDAIETIQSEQNVRIRAVLETFVSLYHAKNWEGDWACTEAEDILKILPGGKNAASSS